jgi:hypothetical protein
MTNFSANNLYLLKSVQYDKANVFYFKDKHTNRTYKLYDYQKTFVFDNNVPYCVSGKINSANNKLYLIIESAKIDNKNSPDSQNSKL